MTRLSKLLYRYYHFPDSLNGALKVTPYFQCLFYLPFLFLEWDTSTFIATIVAHTVLLPIFFRVFWHKGIHAAGLVLILCLTASICLVYSISGIGIFAYAAAACSACRKKSLVYALLALVNVAFLLLAFSLNYSTTAILVGLFFTVINGVNFDYQLRKYLDNRAIQQDQHEITTLAKSHERQRIARDLHDLLGHTLTSISLKSELAERLLSINPEQARRQLQEIQTISRTALQQVRHAVSDYKTRNLSSELINARIVLESLDIELHCQGCDITLPAAIDTVLAMVLREAVTNILRHSRASRCGLTITIKDNNVLFIIRDNGKANGEPSLGNGFKGMRERCQELGGQMQLLFHQGCEISVTLPMGQADNGATI